MAATIVGVTRGENLSVATVTIPVPTGLQVGDVLLAVHRSQSSVSTSYPGNAAFTRLGPYVASSQSGRTSGMWSRVVTNPSGEPSSYTFSVVPEAGQRSVGAIIAIRGLDTANLVAAVVSSYAGTQNVNANVIESLTSPGNCLHVVFSGQEVTDGISHVPAGKPVGFTETISTETGTGTVGSRTALWVGHRQVAAGATGTTSITWNYSGGGPGGQAVLLRIAADPPPVLPGIPVRLSAGRTGRVTGVANGRTIARIRTLRPGFSSVSQMLAKPGATWAHRGGSLNYPEMSEYAYDQSALRGYGALEFSAQRTVDGWWFGLHDPDLNRAAGTTGLPSVSTMTKAQVQAYQNTLLAQGRPRPFYGLVEFLQRWTKTHVVLADPKNAAPFMTEFFDICDAHGGPTKIVAKSYGQSAAFANMATARGYQAWGYFYQNNYDAGELAAWQGPWTLLGMDVVATTAWTGPNNIFSYGKPVVAFIAETQAQYDQAILRGARMVQCANVEAIAPVSAF